MDGYRLLTEREIVQLEADGCRAEDWTSVNVAEDFVPGHVRRVDFYGEVNLGVFEKNIEVVEGFFRHSGICNATLRNVTVGDNCLIENIGNCISGYIIGEECFICNVGLLCKTDDDTFGEGNTVAVLNEAGTGNVVLYRGLTSNIAALMVRHSADRMFFSALRKMINDDVDARCPDSGLIGDRVRIVDTKEIINTNISDNCEVSGALRLSDCTLYADHEDSVCIGSGVVCDNSIIADGSSVLDGATVRDCYVGESCLITDGFTASGSLFFANCQMANGEACAAFCGPFSASHHKSSLLIGCMVSFYNAGSATNFSNHAYKMGPVHYGVLGRGTKTASGSHILLPATIGDFSVCIGKTAGHPNTQSLPFSYVISDGDGTYIVPGRNLVSSGFFRDINKWPRRDARIYGSRRSVINYEWLNPCTVNAMVNGKKILENLMKVSGENASTYTYEGCKITNRALRRGIELYGMALDIFLGRTVAKGFSGGETPSQGMAEWTDLSGLLLPLQEEERIVEGVKSGVIGSMSDLTTLLEDTSGLYSEYLRTFVAGLLTERFGTSDISEDTVSALEERGKAAFETWKQELRKDAEREFRRGDVEQQVLDNFLAQVDSHDF